MKLFFAILFAVLLVLQAAPMDKRVVLGFPSLWDKDCDKKILGNKLYHIT